MKIKILLSCLFYFLLSFTSFANTPYETTLNGLTYKTEKTIIEKDTMAYISLTDLSKMLLFNTSIKGNAYSLVTSKGTLTLQPNQMQYTLGKDKQSMPHPPVLVQDELYIPLDLISMIGYPCTYSLEDNTLDLTVLTPFSLNTDDSSKHLFRPLKENLRQLPRHLVPFSSPEFIAESIATATTQKDYVAFVDQTHYSYVADSLKSRMRYSPYNNMSVTFRKINTESLPTVIHETVTLPLLVDADASGMTLTIGEELYKYPMYWATFLPSRSLTDQDITKTGETTIIRALYEYYRDTYHLRDDKYFNPLTVISSDRTNTFSHGVYTLNADGTETHYDLKIYRVHPSGSMQYMIDLIQK